MMIINYIVANGMSYYLMSKMLSRLISALGVCVWLLVAAETVAGVNLAKGFKDAEQFVREHVGGTNPTDPYVYADKVRELMSTSWRYSSDVNAAFELYSELSMINNELEDNLELTCGSDAETIKIIDSIREAANASGTVDSDDYKSMQAATCLPFKFAAQIVREHSDKCQQVYERRFNEEPDVDEREDGESFGRNFLGHLISLDRLKDVCKPAKELSDRELCLRSNVVKLIGSLAELTDEEATLAVYGMLLELAGDNVEKGALMHVGEVDKKSTGALNRLCAMFRPHCNKAAGKQVLFDKLPGNPKFNELYKRYIVDQCKYIVVELGKDIMGPIEYERVFLSDQIDVGGHSTQFLYAWLAYATCKQLVLDTARLYSFPQVIERRG